MLCKMLRFKYRNKHRLLVYKRDTNQQNCNLKCKNVEYNYNID